MTAHARPPLAVLDLAVVGGNETSADALANTTRLAQHAEALGYTRFWVAEHHNAPVVASTSPAVLIAHLAAVTRRMHIGSGGVMLPNHSALAVAEQFAMLEALHPGRIDLGIGRAPGTDPGTAAELRRGSPVQAVEEFPQSLQDLMGLLGDPRAANGLWDRFIATPAPTTAPLIVLLGSSDYSARMAGQLGLPFAFANHFDSGGTLMALDAYREAFKPSDVLDAPYAIVTASVLAADSDEEARYLAGPGQLMVYGIRSGRFVPLMSPEEAAAHPWLPVAKQMRSNRILGAVSSVVTKLDALVRDTLADEIMVTTSAHSIDERMRTLSLLAQAWFAPAV
jgi:luciferase family oxidoreductase group 1